MFAVLELRCEESNVDPEVFVQCYLGGRAGGTFSTYHQAFRKLWLDSREMGKSLFRWTELDFCGHLLLLDSLEASKNQIKQAGAVHSMLMEVAGLEALTGSKLVGVLKKSCMKRAGDIAKKKSRGGRSVMLLAHVKLLVNGQDAPSLFFGFLCLIL